MFDFFIITCLFAFIYNFPVASLPISSSKIVVILLLFYTIYLSNKKKISLLKIKISPLFLIAILILYSIILVFYKNTNDYSLIYSLFLFVFNHFLGSYLLIIVIKNKKKLTRKYLYELLIKIIVIQSFIIIFMMFFDYFYEIIASISPLATRNSIYMRYDGARGYGLASSITYDLSVVQSFGLIFIAYLYPYENNLKKKYIYSFYYIVILISILVTGRTGLIGLVISIIIHFSNIKITLNNIIVFSSVFAFSFMLIMLFSDNVFLENLVSSIKNYVFEFLVNYQKNGSFSISTGDNLMAMYDYFINNTSLSTLIFGDARYLGEGLLYYRNVDIGFFRQIYYFGLIGIGILLAIYNQTLQYAYKNSSLDKREKHLILFIYIYILISNIKGDILLGGGMIICIWLLIVLLPAKGGRYEKSINN